MGSRSDGHRHRSLERTTEPELRPADIVMITDGECELSPEQIKEVQSLKDKTVDESIVYSISTRLRPKLMTALGAIIALLPLALGIGTGAQLHQPLAIAVIGGF